ncbi:MAG: phage major capsid protein [Hyphomicrobiaceae bacterium]
MRLHEMIEKRASAVTAMRVLQDLADNENRDLTEDEGRQFADHKTAIVALDKRIERTRELETIERAAPAVITRTGDGSFEKRAGEFQVTRAIRAHLPRDMGGGDVDAGFEREMSAEVQRRSGRKFGGIAVPDEVFKRERRTLLVGSSAADLVPTQHRDDLFIDRLRSAVVVERLGATTIDGLVGNVDIPRQTSSSSGQWVGEDGSLTETDAAFDDVSLAPKTVGAMTSYSRRTLLNTAPGIEQIVRNDLTAVLANAIDLKAMLGDGTSNTPIGVINVDGVHEITASGGLHWSKILEFIAEIEHSDAATGTLGWTFNSWVSKTLRGTTKLPDSDGTAGFLMDAPGQLAGYAAALTNALPGNPNTSPATPATMIFGDWSQLLIGRWSGVDLLLNPYESTAYAKGRVIVRAMQDIDVQVRHPEAFSFAEDVSVT